MKPLVSFVVIAAIAVVPLRLDAQHALPPGAEADAFRVLASSIPPGSRVKVQSRDGRAMTAILMAVEDSGVVVKRESRVPEPAIVIPFDQLTRLRLEKRGGFSMAKAIGVGLAAGVGAILTMLAIAVSIGD